MLLPSGSRRLMCERAFSYLQPIVSKGRQVSVGRLDLPYVRPQRRSVALDGGKEQIYTIRFPIVRRNGKLLRTYHGGGFARQVAGHGYKLRSFGIILR